MINASHPSFLNTPCAKERAAYGYGLGDKPVAPHVSIVTPFYNTGTIFHETACSVLQQSLQTWEWLIVNDQSSDKESLEILEHYQKLDPRIHVIHQEENSGSGSTRNLGVRHATAPFIVQLDSDDLLEPTAVEKWLWFLESHEEYAFVGAYCVHFGANQFVWNKGFHYGRSNLEENLSPVTSMIRKEVYQSVKGFDESMVHGLEDWEFWLRCANSDHWGGVIPEYLTWYRRRPDHTDQWDDWSEEGKRRFLKRMRGKYPRLWAGEFPDPERRASSNGDEISFVVPYINPLSKNQPRLLMMQPRLTSERGAKLTLNLVEGLNAEGWETTIVATQHGDHQQLSEFSRWTPDIFILPHFLRTSDYPRFLKYLILSRRIDAIVVSNVAVERGLLTYFRSQFSEIPIIEFRQDDEAWLHGPLSPESVGADSVVDHVVVTSETLRESLLGQGMAPQKVSWCSNVVDTHAVRSDPELRAKIRADRGLSDSVPVILYAAHISAQSQPFVFARTILALSKNSDRFVVLVAGEGPDQEWLYTFFSRHGMSDKVQLLEDISNDRFSQLLIAADIFFQPSRLNGSELSIYQAMACGCPVVGTEWRSTDQEQIADWGYFFNDADEESQVERYSQSLLALLQDLPHGQAMGRRGREEAQRRFSLDELGKKVISTIHDSRGFHANSDNTISPTEGIERAITAAQSLSLALGEEDRTKELERLISRQRSDTVILESKRAHWEGVAAERECIIKSQEQDKNVLEEQRAHSEDVANERERIIKSQEQDKNVLEEQRAHWETIAAERERIIKSQEQDKNVLEEQRAHWETIAAERERENQTFNKRFWIKWGLRLEKMVLRGRR